MTDPARRQAAGAGTATPSPLNIRPRRRATADSGRATARAVLAGALNGVELSPVDQRFIARLSQWDKRSATTVASLIERARQAGRCEVLTAGQLDTVLDALMDAYVYRTSGAAPAGCWDCANRARGLCAEHTRDARRAEAFAELAAVLAGTAAPAAVTAAAVTAAAVTPAAVAAAVVTAAGKPSCPVAADPAVAGPVVSAPVVPAPVVPAPVVTGPGPAASGRPRLDAVPGYRRRRAAVAS